MSEETTIEIAAGLVRGRVDDGIATYLSLPYAAPPTGAHRFAEPAPVPSWSGERDATVAGPTAPQRGARRFAGIDMFAITGSEWRRGEDYLTLNVWAPASGQSRPVLVYVHGGGLTLGTKDAPVYSGRNFARDGVVAVTINYRLGVEGFLAIPGAPTNLGIRDVLAALRWVRDNIAAFGGDPGNVTVFGQSGGGIAVACLVTSPLSAGLFSRAIVASGNGSAVYPIEIARRLTTRVAEILGIAPHIDGFRSVDPERALDALRRASRPGAVDMRDDTGFAPGFGLAVINPVIGDDVLPRHPLDALSDGAAKEVDLLMSTTEEEFNFTTAPTRLILAPWWLARRLVRRASPGAEALIGTYRQKDPQAGGGVILSRILGDLAFRAPAREYAAAHQGRTYFSEFDWDSPASGGRLGASHGTDLAFIFDTLPAVTGPHGVAGIDPPQGLADRVHGLWVGFATDGTVAWPEYHAETRIVRRLSSGVSVSEGPLVADATGVATIPSQ